MDMSFANQALSVEYIINNRGQLAPGVYDVPRDTDAEVGRIKLQAMGINIDTMSTEQQTYQDSWKRGPSEPLMQPIDFQLCLGNGQGPSMTGR